MKNFLLPLILLLSLTTYAQENAGNASTDSIELKYDLYPKNLAKLNIFALPLKNFSLQYERALTKKMSVALGFRLQPKGTIPLQGTVRNFTKDDDDGGDNAGEDFVERAQMGNWALTPEFRYYLGKRPQNGFYVAPYLRAGGFSLDWNYVFKESDGTEHPISMSGNTFGMSFGILLGAQWHIAKKFIVDWWILGPAYGSMKIDLKGTADLSSLDQSAQRDLQEDLEDISDKLDVRVSDDGVKVLGRLPFGGLRTGLCLGYTF